MSKAGEEALAKARKLLASSAGESATVEAKRAFYTQLISLCSYPSYECKAFFGTLVAKHFGQFEDLQDKAVDAILDLCEDDEERIRTIGIKGLGSTGKADPRWVRGNIGVLLQLLECPPDELRLVHEQIFTLLNIAPNDVFAVMLDDCSGSEEETGASRRNILDFLSKHASTRISRLLDDDKNVQAEETFVKGFEGLLRTTPIAEKRQILALLVSAPKVSGKRATSESAGRFCELLTDSLHAQSSITLTRPIIKIFETFIGKNPPLRASDGLRFVVAHGAALVGLYLTRPGEIDTQTFKVVTRWAEEIAQVQGGGKGKNADKEDLCQSVAKVLVKALTDNARSFEKALGDQNVREMLERILIILHIILRQDDTRRKLIGSFESKAFVELGRQATGKAREGGTSEDGARQMQNIVSISEMLANDRLPLKDIILSWNPLPTSSSSIRAEPPSGPRNDREIKPSNSSRMTAGHPTESNLRPLPRSTEPRARRPESQAGPSLRRSPSAARRELLPSSRQSHSSSSAGKELLPQRADPNSRKGQELLGPPRQPSSISDSNQVGSTSNGSRSVSMPTPNATPRTLAERMGVASTTTSTSPSNSAKRAREDTEIGPSTTRNEDPSPRSFLSRLGPANDTQPAKKIRASSPPKMTTSLSQPSLLSRMGSANGNAGPATMQIKGKMNSSNLSSSSMAATNTERPQRPATETPSGTNVPTSLNILNRASSARSISATATPEPKPFSVLNHAKHRASTPTHSPVTESPAQPAQPEMMRIKSASSENEVRKKGRGFTKTDGEDVIMSPPISTPSPVAPSTQRGFMPRNLIRQGSFGRRGK